MTHFLEDILRQPAELQRALDYLEGSARPALDKAVTAVRKADRVYLTGIGASWNAALAAGAYFFANGQPVYMLDASELLMAELSEGSLVVLISRSGDSAEIVKLLAKAAKAGAMTVGITNFVEGLLAREADIPVVVPIARDNGISVSTYTSLALVATAVAHAAAKEFDRELAAELRSSIAALSEAIPVWQQQLQETSWLSAEGPCYFLARGSSLASAQGARLLWEEGVKKQASAMGIDSFRHGPQEVVTAQAHVAIFVNEQTREQDLILARDLRLIGSHLMLIGQQLPTDAAELVLQLPSVPARWQFLVDIVPLQLAAERLAAITGSDCDSFRFASYIVRNGEGLAVQNDAEKARAED